MEAVIIVFLKDFSGFVVVQRAGHHVPGARCFVFLRDGGDCLGENPEKGLVFDRAYRKIPLWAGESEPGPLAACDDESSHFPG